MFILFVLQCLLCYHLGNSANVPTTVSPTLVPTMQPSKLYSVLEFASYDGRLQSCANFAVPDLFVVLTACGFNSDGSPTAMYSKYTPYWKDMSGLGINSDPTGTHEIYEGTFIQLDFTHIPVQPKPPQVKMGSVQLNQEYYAFFGSNKKGVMGQYLMGYNANLNGYWFNLPGYYQYKYISVTCTGNIYDANVLLAALRFDSFSDAPTTLPSYTPTLYPSLLPTTLVSNSPSLLPTSLPTFMPSVAPTTKTPTQTPSYVPTIAPTMSPTTSMPTMMPSSLPTIAPTSAPTTMTPTFMPTSTPSIAPSALPTVTPSLAPTTYKPTFTPTTSKPTLMPTTSKPTTSRPSVHPTPAPSLKPDETYAPSPAPTTSRPTLSPTQHPSVAPTQSPTVTPTISPSITPTIQPTVTPSITPTAHPSITPTLNPTLHPSIMPTVSPSTQPSITPSLTPTTQPSLSPSTHPTTQPSLHPTVTPTVQPTLSPTFMPTNTPSTYKPTNKPVTSKPSLTPTLAPTNINCAPEIHLTTAPLGAAYFYVVHTIQNTDVSLLNTPDAKSAFVDSVRCMLIGQYSLGIPEVKVNTVKSVAARKSRALTQDSTNSLQDYIPVDIEMRLLQSASSAQIDYSIKFLFPLSNITGQQYSNMYTYFDKLSQQLSQNILNQRFLTALRSHCAGNYTDTCFSSSYTTIVPQFLGPYLLTVTPTYAPSNTLNTLSANRLFQATTPENLYVILASGCGILLTICFIVIGFMIYRSIQRQREIDMSKWHEECAKEEYLYNYDANDTNKESAMFKLNTARTSNFNYDHSEANSAAYASRINSGQYSVDDDMINNASTYQHTDSYADYNTNYDEEGDDETTIKTEDRNVYKKPTASAVASHNNGHPSLMVQLNNQLRGGAQTRINLPDEDERTTTSFQTINMFAPPPPPPKPVRNSGNSPKAAPSCVPPPPGRTPSKSISQDRPKSPMTPPPPPARTNSVSSVTDRSKTPPPPPPSGRKGTLASIPEKSNLPNYPSSPPPPPPKAIAVSTSSMDVTVVPTMGSPLSLPSKPPKPPVRNSDSSYETSPVSSPAKEDDNPMHESSTTGVSSITGTTSHERKFGNHEGVRVIPGGLPGLFALRPTNAIKSIRKSLERRGSTNEAKKNDYATRECPSSVNASNNPLNNSTSASGVPSYQTRMSHLNSDLTGSTGPPLRRSLFQSQDDTNCTIVSGMDDSITSADTTVVFDSKALAYDVFSRNTKGFQNNKKNKISLQSYFTTVNNPTTATTASTTTQDVTNSNTTTAAVDTRGRSNSNVMETRPRSSSTIDLAVPLP